MRPKTTIATILQRCELCGCSRTRPCRDGCCWVVAPNGNGMGLCCACCDAAVLIVHRARHLAQTLGRIPIPPDFDGRFALANHIWPNRKGDRRWKQVVASFNR